MINWWMECLQSDERDALPGRGEADSDDIGDDAGDVRSHVHSLQVYDADDEHHESTMDRCSSIIFELPTLCTNDSTCNNLIGKRTTSKIEEREERPLTGKTLHVAAVTAVRRFIRCGAVHRMRRIRSIRLKMVAVGR